MLPSYITDADIDVMQKHLRKRRSRAKRPLFIFPCGGNEDNYSSRRMFKRYVARSKSESLSNVFCLTAEDVARRKSLRELNLLQQEALLVDICDWVIIFAESPGSFCELGAFSALPHAAEITSVAIDRKYRLDKSYLIEGPAREISELDTPLSKVFYLDLSNPFSSAEFSSYVSQLRSYVTANDDHAIAGIRKPINLAEDQVDAGSLAHELLDLLQYIGSVSKKELVDVYCAVKGFKKSSIKVVSRILSEDMKVLSDDKNLRLDIDNVIEMLCAVGLASERFEPCLGSDIISSNVHLESYFMFRGEYSARFSDTQAIILLRKRSRGLGYGDGYRFENRK